MIVVVAEAVTCLPSPVGLTCPLDNNPGNHTQIQAEISRKILASNTPNTFVDGHYAENVVLILTSLVTHTLQDKQLVMYHDGEVIPVAVLGHLMTSLVTSGSVLIFDMTQTTLTSQHWMGDYNDAMFVHILLFENPDSLDQFASSLTPKVWRPHYLLLVSLNTTFPTRVLDNPRFNRSPFLSLLQPSLPCVDPFSRYLILTHESFRKDDKIRTRGSFLLEEAITLQDLFPDRFPTFHGYHFHLASWSMDYPYLHGLPGDNMQGLCYRMLEEISHRLNFTFQVYRYPDDIKWGDFHNGTWRGMIGEVFREEK